MSKSNIFENQLLLLVFNNIAMTLVGDAAGLLPSASAGSLWVGLHTADPGEAGDQSTNEAAYTGYSRVAVVRSAAGWTVVGNTVNPTVDINFGQYTGGPVTPLTHVSVGTSPTGAGKLLYRGLLNIAITPGPGAVPQVTTATTISEE